MYAAIVVATPMPVNQDLPPAFLALASHPVRWRLLRALAWGDLRVWELTALVGERQSLVSYHLGLLREAGLVAARPSSADRRDTYYLADLARWGQQLGDAGAALHPGLGPVPGRDGSAGSAAGRVLFLCTGNGARSQMAEAFMEELTGRRVEAFSAGSHPTHLHPNAVRVMRRYGIDIAGRRAKHLGEFVDQRFDCVVTVCDRVREVCPELPGAARRIHWSIADPADSRASDEVTYPAFERAAAELAARVRFLVPSLVPGVTEVN